MRPATAQRPFAFQSLTHIADTLHGVGEEDIAGGGGQSNQQRLRPMRKGCSWLGLLRHGLARSVPVQILPLKIIGW